MMSDTIYRQAAIDAVNTALFPKINTAKDAEKALKALPSAQPEQRWIPCSERLPKGKGRYLVWYTLGGAYMGIRTALCYPGDWIEWHIDGIPEIGRVLAWMPLPEPYTEDNNDA